MSGSDIHDWTRGPGVVPEGANDLPTHDMEETATILQQLETRPRVLHLCCFLFHQQSPQVEAPPRDNNNSHLMIADAYHQAGAFPNIDDAYSPRARHAACVFKLLAPVIQS